MKTNPFNLTDETINELYYGQSFNSGDYYGKADFLNLLKEIESEALEANKPSAP